MREATMRRRRTRVGARRSRRSETEETPICPVLQQDFVRALDDSSECAFLVGPEQKILSWNTAAEELLGRPRSEALGARCHELIAGRVAGREWCRPHCAVWRSSRRGRRLKSFDLLTHSVDGQQVWVNVSLLVLRHEEGPFTLHLVRDISRQVRFERLVTRLLEAFERYGGWASPSRRARRRTLRSDRATAVDEPALTRREVEVLRFLSHGLSTRAIAEHLGVSHHTVSNHVKNALRKAGLHNRAAAVSFAIRNDRL